MRGLLLHDYYCMKPQITLFIRVILITFIIGLLLLLGMKHGNFKDLVADNDEAFEMLIMTFNIFIPFICGLIPFFLVQWKLTGDKKSGWDKYYFSLPVSDKAKLAATYAATAISVVITFIITMSITMIFNRIAYPDDAGIDSLQLSFGVYFFAVTLSYVLIAAHCIIRNKVKLTILFFTTLIVGQITLSYLLLYSDGIMDIYMKVIDFIEWICTHHLYAVALFAVLIGMLSYCVSLFTIKKRREKLCK